MNMKKQLLTATAAAHIITLTLTLSQLACRTPPSPPRPPQKKLLVLPEFYTMSPEEMVTTKSLLDKPLHQLTEDDISQLTREDCRRYLKEKGMRKPSWNKSQAIQQVISLKTLLEPVTDSDAVTARKKLYIPRPQAPPNRVPRGTSADTEISADDESVPSRQKDSDYKPPDTSCDLPADLVAADNGFVPPRTTGVAYGPVEQLTIFYCGKVNVYDDVPADKAQAIMQLAASPLQFPQETLNDATPTVRCLPGHLQATSIKVGSVKLNDNASLNREESNLLCEENPADGPASRKASVQRYLEKRKDRFKSKRKVGTPSSASLDIYFNHQIGYQTSSEHSGRSGGCSPSPIQQSNFLNRSSSLENNVVKSAKLSAALDDNDLQD